MARTCCFRPGGSARSASHGADRRGHTDLARHHRLDLAPVRRAAVAGGHVHVSTDPQLEATIRDVVGLYLHLPAKAVVICVDEKPQIQALQRTAPTLPVGPGIRRRPASTTSAAAPPRCSPPSRWPPAR